MNASSRTIAWLELAGNFLDNLGGMLEKSGMTQDILGPEQSLVAPFLGPGTSFLKGSTFQGDTD